MQLLTNLAEKRHFPIFFHSNIINALLEKCKLKCILVLTMMEIIKVQLMWLFENLSENKTLILYMVLIDYILL